MIKSLSKPRSKSNLIHIHMKFILLVIIGALLWNNNVARQFTSDQLQNASDFIQPEQQRMINISFWIMNTTQDNIIDRDELQDKYICSLIDCMDHQDLKRFMYETLSDNLDKYTLKEIIEEVEYNFPELLDDTIPDESTGWN